MVRRLSESERRPAWQEMNLAIVISGLKRWERNVRSKIELYKEHVLLPKLPDDLAEQMSIMSDLVNINAIVLKQLLEAKRALNKEISLLFDCAHLASAETRVSIEEKIDQLRAECPFDRTFDEADRLYCAIEFTNAKLVALVNIPKCVKTTRRAILNKELVSLDLHGDKNSSCGGQEGRDAGDGNQLKSTKFLLKEKAVSMYFKHLSKGNLNCDCTMPNCFCEQIGDEKMRIIDCEAEFHLNATCKNAIANVQLEKSQEQRLKCESSFKEVVKRWKRGENPMQTVSTTLKVATNDPIEGNKRSDELVCDKESQNFAVEIKPAGESKLLVPVSVKSKDCFIIDNGKVNNCDMVSVPCIFPFSTELVTTSFEREIVPVKVKLDAPEDYISQSTLPLCDLMRLDYYGLLIAKEGSNIMFPSDCYAAKTVFIVAVCDSDGQPDGKVSTSPAKDTELQPPDRGTEMIVCSDNMKGLSKGKLLVPQRTLAEVELVKTAPNGKRRGRLKGQVWSTMLPWYLVHAARYISRSCLPLGMAMLMFEAVKLLGEPEFMSSISSEAAQKSWNATTVPFGYPCGPASHVLSTCLL